MMVEQPFGTTGVVGRQPRDGHQERGTITSATPASSHASATPLSISSDAGSVRATGSDFSIRPMAPTRPLRSELASGSGPA